MSDNELFDRFRFPRPGIIEIINLLSPHLERPTARNSSLSVPLQVCLALRYYATGIFQREAGDLSGVSRMTASRVIHDVSEALCREIRRFIKFPNSPQQLRNVAHSFYLLRRIPNVCGAIDGSHIAIKRPTVNEHVYVNRKGFHSINVQAICDADFTFTNIVVRYPGSTHDSFIWTNCSLYHKFSNGHFDGFHLLENRYNRAHCGTRFKIENTFGIWKSRFRCLDKSSGSMQYSPERCCKIITATAILHNIAIRGNFPPPPEEDIHRIIQYIGKDMVRMI
ncbi:UNVERIFIED_CONTAM: hypothetical protein GTU68_060049 [Idotea baltica]|nr:hypothetical protein [Idotea baltica]